jgi:hypothetical protein
MTAYTIATRGGERLVVERRRYRKSEIVSLRTWYLNVAEGKWFPTTKGINLSVKRWQEVMPELVRLLDLAGEESALPTVLTRRKPKTAGKL